MQQETLDNQNGRTETYLWVAGAVGAAAGIAALVATRHRETPWERTQRRALEVAERARKEVKPWMGLAAGAAVGGASLAYKLRQKPTGWELARRRAGEVAGQASHAVQPWMSLATSVAMSAVALARSRRKQQRMTGMALESAGESANKMMETGARLIKRVQQLSGQTRKLYPRVKRLIA